MKSFFSGLKLGAPSTPTASSSVHAPGLKRSPSQADAQMPDMLGKAEKLLNRLRSSTEHDFPLLNEATRLVQLLEGAVTKMPESDMKGVWREQVNELQRSLQSATEQMLAQDAKPANDALPAKHSQAGKSASRGLAEPPAEETSSAGGYAAPRMPVESMDMFSGLDLTGFAPSAAESAAESAPAAPELTQSNAQPTVQHSSGSVPLPADLFSGLESLTVEPPTHSQTAPTISTATDPAPSSQSNAAAAAAAAVKPAPVLSGPSIPAHTHSQASSTHQTANQPPPNAHSNTLPGASPASAPVAAPTAATETRRKKKTTRRVGYARDQAEDSPAERTASGSSSLASTPLASAALPSPHTAPLAAQAALPSDPAPVGAAAAATRPLPSTQPILAEAPTAKTTTADAQQHRKLAATGSTSSPAQSLQQQAAPTQPASPTKAAATQGLPTASGSPRRQHKAVAPQAPATVVQLASLSLPEAVVAAGLATPAQAALPASSQGHKALPAALTADTLLQVAKGSSFEAGLQAVQGRAEQQVALLGGAIKTAIQDEQAARQKRHTFTLEAVSDMGKVRQLEEAEQLAVEQEDFESAANLSSELDSLRAHIQALERSARGAEGECEAAVKRRVDIAVQQVAVWQAAAQATAKLQAAQEQKAAKATRHSEKEASKLADSIAASEEHVEELKGRITARQDWIAREQESVDSKIEEATRPVAAQRAEAAQQHSALDEEVKELRRQLLKKEEALAAAADKLGDIEQHMQSLAAKYDKTLTRLAEDRKAVASEAAERDAEESAVQRSREQAIAAQAAAQEEQAQFDEQVSAAAAAARDMLSKAAAISTAVEAEEELRQVQASLRECEEQSNDAVKELERDLEASRVAVRALANQRASLANEAGSAEGQAAAAQRRIPELDADKKAAAAARDFKGAAALSAESKALAAQADVSTAKAKKLRQQVSEAEDEEQMQVDNIKQQETQLATAKKAAGLARWRRLQSSMQGLARQVEEAAAADKYEEATALQAELDSSTQEADALAAEYSLTPNNMQDLVSSPTPTPTPTLPTEQTLKGVAPAVLATKGTKIATEPGGPPSTAVEDAATERKTQGSQELSSALSREEGMEYEDRESVDPDEDGRHVDYSSSVISASHAATDGSRSVQSSRTVLDRMPEFNMADDAVSFRSVSSSRSQSQAVNADTRSVRTMSTIIDDVDKPDEADETSSFRSMSSTTSTNYGAPKPRPSATPLYTIPDEAVISEGGSEGESSSQSETEAAQDLPASAAAQQALHQEADNLIPSSQPASSSANSDVSVGPASGSENKSHAQGKSLGSNGSFSEASELGPVSETESSRRTTSNGGDDEGSHTVGQHTPSGNGDDAHTQQLPESLTHQAGSDGISGTAASMTVSTVNQHKPEYPLSHGAMATNSLVSDPDSLHTPRAMGPPATPDAPLVPKIDAGPAEDPSVGVKQLHVDAEEEEAKLESQEGQTMFAGLDMM